MIPVNCRLGLPPEPTGVTEEELIDPGRPWLLRLLALLGALAFVMLGINSLLPAFEPPTPRPMPDQRNRTIT